MAIPGLLPANLSQLFHLPKPPISSSPLASGPLQKKQNLFPLLAVSFCSFPKNPPPRMLFPSSKKSSPALCQSDLLFFQQCPPQISLRPASKASSPQQRKHTLPNSNGTLRKISLPLLVFFLSLSPRQPTSVSLFSPVPPPSIQPILGLTIRKKIMAKMQKLLTSRGGLHTSKYK